MPERVLVVDDDDIAGGLSRELLAEAGFEAELQTNSLKAIEQIKRERYALVILDILMPGLDGLTLCHKIKNEPEIKDTKVVMVSGKAFDADKQRAREYGAELFIEKPYNVETFVQQIREVLGRGVPLLEVSQDEIPQLSSEPSPAMEVTVWGGRSRSSGPGASRYGFKTSCVSVQAAGKLLVFDAGSGLAELGAKLKSEGRVKELWLFMTHFHPDHTEGLASLPLAADPEATLHISGAADPDKSLPEMVQAAFDSAPAKIASVEARIELYEMLEQTYEVLPGLKVTAFYANHPGKTLGFVLECEGRRMVYCPDSELYGEAATALQDYDERLGRICRGADLVIHDARYTPEDYRTLRNHGHSSFASAIDFAGRHEIKKLLLFHLDERYDDAALDRVGADALRLIRDRNYKLEVAVARAGLTVAV